MSQANKEVSNALFQAYISKEPIEFVSKTYNLTEPEAYKTQDDLIHQIQAEKNVPVKGYKVSMTSLQLKQLLILMNQHTVLFLSHQVVENGHGVSLTTLFAPLLEPEIIFELTADLPEDADTQTILESVKSHQASKFQMHVIKIGSQISL